MKRLAVIVSIVVVLVAGAAVAVLAQPATPTQEERAIPVTVTSALPDDHDRGFCAVPIAGLDVANAAEQLVVTDQAGTILAIHTLANGVLEQGTDGSLRCLLDVSIPVPAAEFYTLYLGDQRVTGFSAAQFPLDGADTVRIQIEATGQS